MIRRATTALALTILVSGCGQGGLGRSMPSCELDQTSATIILAVQAVPGTEYVPCVNELKAGWEYEHMEARSGRARFWVGSDRVGERFLEVTLESACDREGMSRVVSDEDPVPLYADVQVFDVAVSLVIVPESAEPIVQHYASNLAETLRGAALRDWAVGVRVDLSDDPVAERIARALEAGDPVLVVGPREQEEGVAELYLPGGAASTRLAPADVLNTVEDHVGEPSYQATWRYPFRNGCVTYRIDAEGPGADAIAAEVQEALGLYPVDPLRRYAEEVGWYIP